MWQVLSQMMRPTVSKGRLCHIKYHYISNNGILTFPHLITITSTNTCKTGNFHGFQFSTDIKSEKHNRSDSPYQSLKDEYSSSPFRSTSGTSIDPLFDPDSIAHPDADIIDSPHHKPSSRRLQRGSSKLKKSNDAQFSEIDTITVIDDEQAQDIEQHLDDTDIKQLDPSLEDALKKFNPNKQINNDFDDNKKLLQSKTFPGWKKRAKKVEKYRNHIVDPLERPIIHKKRVFNQGDKCEGCGVLLQNTDPDKVGYVHDIETREKTTCDPMESESQDANMEMKDVYIPDHQRLLLIDLGIMDKNQKYLTYDQYMTIQQGNKKANVCNMLSLSLYIK